MSDLKRVFDDLDRLDSMVAWSEVKQRRPGPPTGEPERTKRILAASLALAVGAAGIAVAVRAFVVRPGGRPAPPATSAPTPSISPPPPGWVRHADDSGVFIDTPASWTFNSDPVPALAGPVMLFAVGTGPVPTGGDCAPRPAIDALPHDGSLFAIQEYGSVDEPYTFPPRPTHFTLGPLLGPFECFGVKAHEVQFQDGGRFFQVFAMFGPDATRSLRQQVEQSLDSLRVNPLQLSAQPAAKCRGGEWTACPEAAWLYRVIVQAQVSHLGHRGDQAILGMAGKSSFALWTTSASKSPIGGQCNAVAGTTVCQAGARLVWGAQGLWLWVEPAPSPYASLHTTPALPTGATLDRLIRSSRRVQLVVP